MSDHDEHADLTKHSDHELRAGIDRSLEQEQRIAEEDSQEALDAARRQRAAMEEELRRRGS
jgi:hypothetical protein